MIRKRGKKESAQTGGPGCGFLRPDEVDALLEGRLMRDRMIAFEQHESDGCGPCSLLAADMQVYREVTENGLLENEKREFEAVSRRTLERLQMVAERGRLRLSRTWGFGVATAAAVLCVALLAWPILRQPVEPVTVPLPAGGDMVVEAMPFSAPPVLRGEEAPEDLWRHAGEAYEAERFRKAARYLTTIEEKQPGHADTSLYLGISLLMAGKPAEARAALAGARERAAALELPQSAAAWYEALAALAAGDQAGAQRALAAAAEEGGLYGDRARQLLETWPNE